MQCLHHQQEGTLALLSSCPLADRDQNGQPELSQHSVQILMDTLEQGMFLSPGDRWETQARRGSVTCPMLHGE